MCCNVARACNQCGRILENFNFSTEVTFVKNAAGQVRISFILSCSSLRLKECVECSLVSIGCRIVLELFQNLCFDVLKGLVRVRKVRSFLRLLVQYVPMTIYYSLISTFTRFCTCRVKRQVT